MKDKVISSFLGAFLALMLVLAIGQGRYLGLVADRATFYKGLNVSSNADTAINLDTSSAILFDFESAVKIASITADTGTAGSNPDCLIIVVVTDSAAYDTIQLPIH